MLGWGTVEDREGRGGRGANGIVCEDCLLLGRYTRGGDYWVDIQEVGITG